MNIPGKQDIDTEDGKEMSIYVNVEEINNYDVFRGTEDTVTKTKQTSQHTGSERVMRRSYRSVTVCLVLLCVLLLTAVIVLCVLINTNNQQFNIKNKNITEERDQLLLKYKNLTKENERLLTNNNNPNEQHLNQLIQQIKAIMKTDGWIYYQFSLYFISSEKKSWSDSRRYCVERGADLIIINNKEEQDFIQNNSGTDLLWVGLTHSYERRWKWVDGSTPTSSFWVSNKPSGLTPKNCAASYLHWWYDYSCADALKWICEKKYFC